VRARTGANALPGHAISPFAQTLRVPAIMPGRSGAAATGTRLVDVALILLTREV
jgi:hypothetical protein